MFRFNKQYISFIRREGKEWSSLQTPVIIDVLFRLKHFVSGLTYLGGRVYDNWTAPLKNLLNILKLTETIIRNVNEKTTEKN